MADTRYKNGVYVGSYSKANAIKSQQRSTSNNPLDFGWTFAYHNTEYNLRIFSLGHFKMMQHPKKGGWIVEDNITQQQHHYINPLLQITRDVKSQLPSPTTEEKMLTGNLVALKRKFDPPPTTPAPATPPLPRPFAKITFKAETLTYLKQQEEQVATKTKAGEVALQAALRPDPVNRRGNFNRNLNWRHG